MISLVTVETRIIDLKFIHQHISMISEPYNLVYFGIESNKQHVLSQYPDCIFVDCGIENFSFDEYNKLLTNPWFWEQIPDENILIFQYDSYILKKGIEKFFQWDYVGSPWISPECGGNGGISIRKKSVMLECIRTQPNFDRFGNEDGHFCDVMLRYGIGKVAPRNVCEEFGCETIFKLGTYCCHKINGYMHPEQCEQIYNQYKHVWIIGKGKSILRLKKEQIGDGLVITLNSAIKIVENLGLDNEIWSMQKDGSGEFTLNDCPSLDCHNCPYDGVYPKKAKLLIHKHESMQCMTDYPERFMFDAEQLGLVWRTESVLVAIELALSYGYNTFHFIGFDAVTDGSIDNINGEELGGYLPQAERLKERVKTLNYEFI